MNRLIAGRPGGGKSYHAVELIVDFLAQARVVVTNVPLRLDRIEKLGLPGMVKLLDDEQMASGSFFGDNPGAVFVLDEVRKYLPQGITQKDLPQGWDRMLSEHRHTVDWRGRSAEIILISQCASQIPKCVRTLVDTTTICTKLHKVGLAKFYTRTLYEGPQTLLDPKKANLLKADKGKYLAKNFRLYRSHSQAKDDSPFAEDTGRGVSVIPRIAAMLVASVALVGVSVWAFSATWAAMSSDELAKADSESGETTGADGGRAASVEAVRALASAAETASREAVSTVDPLRLSAFWQDMRTGQCGGINDKGERVEVTCRQLRGARTVAVQRSDYARPGGSGLDLLAAMK